LAPPELLEPELEVLLLLPPHPAATRATSNVRRAAEKPTFTLRRRE
jgi:hypothetical protein